MAVSIKELKKKLSELKARMKELDNEISEAALEDEDCKEQEEEFEKAKSHAERIQKQIKQKEDEETEEKEEDEKEEKSYSPAIIKGQIGSGLNPAYAVGRKFLLSGLVKENGHGRAKKTFIDAFGTKEYDFRSKDLTSTSQPLLAQEYKGFIELVRAETVIRNIANTIDISENGNVSTPRAISGSTAAFVGEGQIIPSTAPNFDTVNFLWKKMAATTSMTKELALYGAFDVARYVSEDLARQLGIGEDAALINNTARTETSPMGLYGYSTTSGNVITETANDFATINNTLYKAISAIAGNNFNRNKLVWIMPVQVELFLRSISTTLGIYPFADQMDRTGGKLFGCQVYTSNLIPTNQGSTSNISSIYLLDPTYAQFASASGVELITTDVGSLSDASGVVSANAFAQNLTLFRITERFDFQVTLDNSLYRIDVTDWSLENQGAVPFNIQTPNYAGSNASGAIGKVKPASTSTSTSTSTSSGSTAG